MKHVKITNSMAYDVYATGIAGEKLNGGIGWEVYINGVLNTDMSSGPYGCGNDKDHIPRK